MKINIAIVDDHNVVISGVENMLHVFPHMSLTAMYNCGEALLAGLKKDQPDVLLMDIQLPDINGDELTAIITDKYPAIRILAMTGFDTGYYVQNMLKKGATGYLLKNTNADILGQAIETVYKGDRFIDPALRQQLIDSMLMNKKQEFEEVVLSRREKEVLKLIVTQHTNQQIAKMLFISPNTVANQRASLMQKLQVKNTAGLVKIAVEMGLTN